VDDKIYNCWWQNKKDFAIQGRPDAHKPNQIKGEVIKKNL
jgi:hypothetical protein